VAGAEENANGDVSLSAGWMPLVFSSVIRTARSSKARFEALERRVVGTTGLIRFRVWQGK